jgi:hypothetical protein
MTQLAFDASIAQRFEEFHKENPAVYSTLVWLAKQWARRTGNRKLGIKTLYERARWELELDTTDQNPKLNNNFTAFYARLLMLNEPDLAGMFDLRASEADAWVDQYYRRAS